MSGKVLITGGAGFIGFHLARLLLNRGWQVHLVDNFMRGRNDQDLETILDEEGITLSNIDLLSNKINIRAWYRF